MGNYITTAQQSLNRHSNQDEGEGSSVREAVSEHTTSTTSSRRRRRANSVNEQTDDVEEVAPKRKHLQTTSSYIYETLYQQSTGSDVTIVALEKEWKLHKIYLCQAGYFSSMFSGRWKESDDSIIHLDIPDPNITIESLDLVFGSLYKDNVTLEIAQMLSTVATATMLQCEGLLHVCEDFMKETLCVDTVLPYLDTANLYSLAAVKEECMSWLFIHLLTSFNVSLLISTSVDVMTELVESTELFVMQVEMDLYTLVKKWLFLKFNSSWTGSLSKLASSTDEYFKSLLESNGRPFLETDEGSPYKEVFRSLRLRNILTDTASVTVLESDGVIPKGWLFPLYRDHWLKMILVEQRVDAGPNFQSDEEFARHAVRCGRVLTTPNEYCWRWTGFSYGVDILLIYSNGLISVKRNTHSQPCLASVSLHTSRQITLRLRVVSFTESSSSLRSVATSQDTGVLRLSLGQDEGHHIMTLHKDAQFPLYLSFYFSLVSMSETARSLTIDER